MEWPKRVRTADWESGILTLDGEKKFEVPELIMNLIERLASYTHLQALPHPDRPYHYYL